MKPTITFDHPNGKYISGEQITGKVHVVHPFTIPAASVTLELFYRISSERGGKEEGVHQGFTLAEGIPLTAQEPRSFPFALDWPSGPFSYSGKTFAIHWYLVARAGSQSWTFTSEEYPITLAPAGPTASGAESAGAAALARSQAALRDAAATEDESAAPVEDQWGKIRERKGSIIGFFITLFSALIGFYFIPTFHRFRPASPSLYSSFGWGGFIVLVVIAALALLVVWAISIRKSLADAVSPARARALEKRWSGVEVTLGETPQAEPSLSTPAGDGSEPENQAAQPGAAGPYRVFPGEDFVCLVRLDEEAGGKVEKITTCLQASELVMAKNVSRTVIYRSAPSGPQAAPGLLAGRLEYRMPLKAPSSAPPSWYAHHHRLVWEVELTLKTQGRPVKKRAFPIEVINL